MLPIIFLVLAAETIPRSRLEALGPRAEPAHCGHLALLSGAPQPKVEMRTSDATPKLNFPDEPWFEKATRLRKERVRFRDSLLNPCFLRGSEGVTGAFLFSSWRRQNRSLLFGKSITAFPSAGNLFVAGRTVGRKCAGNHPIFPATSRRFMTPSAIWVRPQMFHP